MAYVVDVNNKYNSIWGRDLNMHNILWNAYDSCHDIYSSYTIKGMTVYLGMNGHHIISSYLFSYANYCI